MIDANFQPTDFPELQGKQRNYAEALYNLYFTFAVEASPPFRRKAKLEKLREDADTLEAQALQAGLDHTQQEQIRDLAFQRLVDQVNANMELLRRQEDREA